MELYSRRQKRLKGELPDVYQYTQLPHAFRVQVIHIVSTWLGIRHQAAHRYQREVIAYIHHVLLREYGRFALTQEAMGRMEAHDDLYEFILEHADIEHVLDAIELIFQIFIGDNRIPPGVSEHRPLIFGSSPPETTVQELNQRFREHAIGFQFQQGDIIRVDSQIIHGEVVLPALGLLAERGFEGPNDEMMSAFEHHRHGRNEEAMSDCLKSFESTMKVIYKQRGWPFDPKDTASKLIAVGFTNGLIPDYLQQHYTALQASLVSGIPTPRNRLAGHGQGATIREVPDWMVAYHIHITASTILFLVSAHKALGPTP